MKYLVDVYHTYAHTVEIEAEGAEEAEEKALDMDKNRKIDPSDFHKTDDLEVRCCGYVDGKGVRHFD